MDLKRILAWRKAGPPHKTRTAVGRKGAPWGIFFVGFCRPVRFAMVGASADYFVAVLAKILL